MNSRFRFGMALAAALCPASLAGPGCNDPTGVYVPEESAARDAIDAALAGWQKGEKPDQFSSSDAAVHFVDSQWNAGQTLESYRILDEEIAGAETEKRYAVVLKLKKSDGEKRVEYIAVGRSPMWIFRDEDYVKQVSMGEEPKAQPKRRSRGR